MTAPAGIAFFDLDGTITRRDSMLPFVFRWLARRPTRWWRLLLLLPTLLAFAMGRADRGALKGQLLHVTLGGLPRTSVESWAGVFADSLLRRGVFAAALERIEFHRQAGHYLVLMSASVDCYVPQLGLRLGFDETLCSPVRWQADGTLDGRLDGPNCRGEQKVLHLRAMLERIPAAESWAYGNSRADIPHLLCVAHGVYVNGSAADIPAGATHVECVQWT